MNEIDSRLHQKALEIARKYRQAESELIDLLQAIDDKKIFRHLNYSSLFVYVTEGLNLSEAVACNLINIARKSKEIPQLKEEIRKGNLTVSKARKISAVITQDNASEWIDKTKTLPRHKLEKEVAKVDPKAAVPEKAKYVQAERIALQMGISEGLMKKLRRAQDVLCQKKKKFVQLEEVLDGLVENYLEHEDPIRKARRNIGKKTTKTLSFPGTINVDNSANKRRPILAGEKHMVILRDQAQCTFHDHKGKRCAEKRWLEMDHKKAVSQGGDNRENNLQLLCFHHHKAKHMPMN